MALSVNKVILVGNIGKDPEVKFLPSGQAVANFSIATSEKFKGRDGGEMQEKTEWHNVVAYSKVAEIIRDFAKKGAKIYVEGRLTTRNWDDKETGKKVYRTEIVVNEFVLLSGRGEGGESAGGGYSRGSGSSQTASFDQRPAQAQEDYAQSAEITDDDIPF